MGEEALTEERVLVGGGGDLEVLGSGVVSLLKKKSRSTSCTP